MHEIVPYHDPSPPQTAYDVSRDPHMLALVCEALVLVARAILREQRETASEDHDWRKDASPDVVFAMRAMTSPERYQHMTALAILADDDAPPEPDRAWCIDSIREQWPSLALAGLYGGL